jgi:hypothetical protein
MVILVSPNVKEETRRILRNDGAIITEVPNLVNPYKAAKAQGQTQRYLERFEFTLNKLYVWNLTQYERVVYLDADNIALGNLDELFDCGHFCAVFMNPCNFHTGLLVIKPDTAQFDYMVNSLRSGNITSYDGADQGFLTAFFPFEVSRSLIPCDHTCDRRMAFFPRVSRLMHNLHAMQASITIAVLCVVLELTSLCCACGSKWAEQDCSTMRTRRRTSVCCVFPQATT